MEHLALYREMQEGSVKIMNNLGIKKILTSFNIKSVFKACGI